MESSPPSTSDGAHLDSIRVEEIEEDKSGAGIVHLDEEGNEIGAEFDPVEPEQVTRDGFFVLFRTAFDLPGQIMPDFKPLAVQPEEECTARAASDALYSLLEIYYPSALLPQSETLAHLLTLGPFVLGKAMVVKAILDARRRPPVHARKPQDTEAQSMPSPPPGVSSPSPVDWMAAEGPVH